MTADTPGAGHNSIAVDQLRLLIERIERLEEEKKAMADDIKDVYLEAKSTGFNPAMMRYTVKMRKLQKDARDTLLAEQEMYLSALGLA